MRNLKEDKLYIQTFREIRSYIITHELKAGDSLPTEQAMCQMLGVSRNVLREAIKSMELMGMIQSCPGSDLPGAWNSIWISFFKTCCFLP